MNEEMRVRIESTRTVDGELRSAWFTLPVYEEELEEMLGITADSEDYRIIEKELPFAEEVDEETKLERLNDLYSTFQSLPADLKEDYGELMCHFTSLDELHQHRNDLIHYSWCKNMTDVAKHLVENGTAFSGADERLIRYFDFEAYGQYLDDNGTFLETEHGIYEVS